MLKKEIKGIPRMHIRMPNANTVIYGVFEKSISKDDLEKAILHLSEKHKLLNCLIKTDEENKVWFVIDEKLIPEVILSKSGKLDEILINEFKHCFDFDNGPLIRFTLLNQSESILIINCHHAICDGLSHIYLLKDIIKVLSGTKVETEEKMPVFLEPENIPLRLGSSISRFIIRSINKKWSKRQISFPKEIYQEIHTKFWKEYDPQIVRFGFSKEETASLISQCKQNHITVNTGLVTAFLYAEKQLFEKKDYSDKVIVTDNLRPHLIKKPGESMGFFISTLKPSLEYSEKKAFMENAQLFQTKIKGLLKKDLFNNQQIGLFSPAFLDVMMLNYFGLRNDTIARIFIKAVGMHKLSSTFTIANLGLIDISDNSDKFRIKTLSGPMAHSNGMEKYIGVLTLNNELQLSICFNGRNIDRESICKIVKLIPGIFEVSQHDKRKLEGNI